MNRREVVVIFGLLACVSCAHLKPNVTLLPCESPEAEAAAQAALDFINAQHTHGYKYALNQIEDIKVTKNGENEIYLLELEFLETKCHVLDPTPVSLCEVRRKVETAIEADCDVVLSKAGEQFSLMAFKCKTETETVDFCGGCQFLVPLNDTKGVQAVQESLALFNKNNSANTVFALLEIGRLSHQSVAQDFKVTTEYAITETNCSSSDDGICTPLDHTVARHGLCHSESIGTDMKVDCVLFASPVPGIDPVTNATILAQPKTFLHAHNTEPGYTPSIDSLTHHKLTALHNPNATSLLSSESESAEVSPIVKRELVEVPIPPLVQDLVPQLLLPRCPGKKKHF